MFIIFPNGYFRAPSMKDYFIYNLLSNYHKSVVIKIYIEIIFLGESHEGGGAG